MIKPAGATPSPIGFIGLGNMGARMASCLLRAGYDVLGYDSRPGAIAASGAAAAQSISDVTRAADIVLLSLPDSKAVEAVVLAEDGVLANARDGQIVIDLSTSAPASTLRLQRELSTKGCSLVDCGISGGAAAADKGQLTLMVGTDGDSVLDRVRPVLAAFASNVYVCGAVGSGHTVKLLNNFLNAIALSATSEVMVAARKADLDLGVVLDVLNSSSGVNFATLKRFPHIIHGDYLEGGLTNTLMLKDVAAYVELLGQLGISSLNASAPVASFGLALQLGYANRISNTVVDAIGDISGGIRLHDTEE